MLVASIRVLIVALWLYSVASAQSLDFILDGAKQSHSDAVLVWRDGDYLVEYYSASGPKPIHAMSCTKSVVSLAVGKLITDGVIPNLDEPVWRYFPEWKQGKKELVTLRHLLSHTSGLQNVPHTGKEIYPSPDFVRLALAAELTNAPGESFSYNNKAVNLISGVIENCTDQTLGDFVGETIFAPLGIENYRWDKDEAGHSQAMAGLHILPEDLLKLGRLVLSQGNWNGESILSPEFLEEAVKSQGSPTCGLLWWIVPERFELVIDDATVKQFLDKIEHPELAEVALSVRGRYQREELKAVIEDAFAPYFETVPNLGPMLDRELIRFGVSGVRGYAARGYLGQYLIVLPKSGIVAVRMVGWSEQYDKSTDGYHDFERDILKLADEVATTNR